MPFPPSPRSLLLPLSAPAVADAVTLPSVLTGTGSRGAGGTPLPLVPNLRAIRSWPLARSSRSADAPAQAQAPADRRLLALEATDGSTVFIRADALAERIARVQPMAVSADGVVDLRSFDAPGRATRGGASEWLWKQVTELALEPDSILDQAREKAEAWLTGKVEDWAVAWASREGAKALMEAIESQLAAEPGLYRWNDRGGALAGHDLCRAGDPRLQGLRSADQAALVFIHGTGSHTLGSFGELAGSSAWQALTRQFGEHIYGLEHRTFSQSPIDNALLLLEALPDGARISLVSHSRGGLVGDLLCLDANQPDLLEKLIGQYRRKPRSDEQQAEAANPALTASREAAATAEQTRLRQLVAMLQAKRLRIERYVRVACPARGTALLSDNLDVFLSGLLTLVRKFGAWSAGAVAGAVASPLAAEAAHAAAERWLKLLARVVLEIADKRLDPRVVPGIEAMLPEAPMGAFLGRAPSTPGLKMALIAGDIEGGGLLQRIGVLFTDWALFDRMDNDLVVDTSSMYAGIAQAAAARQIFVQGAEVNHFRYFRDGTVSHNTPLPSAMQRWLAEPQTDSLLEWQPLDASTATRPRSRGAAAEPDAGSPVLFYLPGIMGSNLAADGKRIWLDFPRLAEGDLERIRMERPVTPDGVVGLAYGELEDYLSARYALQTHAYDWRQPLTALGRAFADRLQQALDAGPQRPLRILAHSMGGLVVRSAFTDTDLRERFFAHPDSRLVLLGTPNQGSHLMVQTLLGLSDTIRLLARLDLAHDMAQVLEIVGGFAGAINLLPAPSFTDTGGYTGGRFYNRDEWLRLKALNDDIWFGQNLCGVPTQTSLDDTRAFWSGVADTAWAGTHAERICYVHGQAEATPCGLIEQKDASGKPLGLQIVETPAGDGSVTWASGALPGLPDERRWLMDADHMGLVSTPKYFADIEALLEGHSPQLSRLPISRGADAAAAVVVRRPGPPPAWPSEAEATLRTLGGRPPRRRSSARSAPLAIRVCATDLRFVQSPLLCGHYRKDPIAGPEAVIDREIVRGALSQRLQMGIHSGELGNATVVLMPRTIEERLRGSGRGAVVVGLGEMGKLGADGVIEAVRAGALRYLLHASDRYGEECRDTPATPVDGRLGLNLASLLIGSNSATQLPIEESVRAVVRGVLLANHDYARATRQRGGLPAQVTRLDLIEVYRDNAISASKALLRLKDDLARDLERLGARLEVDPFVLEGEGAQHRLEAQPITNYWPRLMVVDADQGEQQCAPECYTPRISSPIPPEALKRLLAACGCKAAPDSDTSCCAASPEPPPVVRHAERLRYAYLGERARAEMIIQQRQPGLVEKLVDSALSGGDRSVSYVPGRGFGATLFQLLIPQEFKAAARKMGNLVLTVDETTANLPWEMLEADGEPLIRRTRLVRQFISARFRHDVVRASANVACVISNPSTLGYHAQFGGPDWRPGVTLQGEPEVDRLTPLPGAEREGEVIGNILQAAGYEIEATPAEASAFDVIGLLLARPYRVLVIDAHGVFAKRARDGRFRSGVVLSDGLLLTAAEVTQMETVPDLVFLNCCHLAKAGVGGHNRLAAGLSRELIEMGVRCVVAAGWEVRDDAARSFAETFFEHLMERGATFGDALFEARNATFERHPECNTWGAYQAYGDPTYRLANHTAEPCDNDPLAAPEELVAWLTQRRLDTRSRTEDAAARDLPSVQRRIDARLASLPDSWRQRADVQFALAELYWAFGSSGFERARAAYKASIEADTRLGVAPIKAIEQLANLLARSAEALARRNKDGSRTGKLPGEAARRIDEAIQRLESLSAYSAADHMNPERHALRGSAYKRKAYVLLSEGADWLEIEPFIRLARDAYAHGSGDTRSGDFDPYLLINRLQLDVLLGETPPDLGKLVDRCQTAARTRFEQRYEFWDGVMPVDAALAQTLARDVTDPAADAARLACAYHDEVAILGPSPREFDSVAQQIRLLADFFRVRDAAAPEATESDAKIKRKSRPSATEPAPRLAAMLDELAGLLARSG